MRAYLTAASALCVLGACAAAAEAEPSAPGYRVYSETLLLLDRWRGTEAVVVERTDVRQRLRLDAWGLVGEAVVDGKDGGPRLDLVIDLEIGSDLGPSLDMLEAIPDGRRTVLDLYRAHLQLRAWDALDARLGRLVLQDALGFDAVDGAAVELAVVPFVTARVHGGLGVRRAWSNFGPELYEPDDTLLRDEAGAVVGAGLASRGLDAWHVDLAWRRHFAGIDADGGLVRDELGAAVFGRPVEVLDLSAGAIGDLIFLRLSELRAGAGLRLGESGRVEGEWRRVHPSFAADSIWSWFVTEPSHAGRVAASWRPGLWFLGVDGELRRFDDGADAWIGGARVDRGVGLFARPARVGVDARVGTGYGGERHHVDVYGRIPVPVGVANEPVDLRFRLGAAYFDVTDRDDYDGWAGWAVLAGEWQATPRMRLDGTLEGHAHRAEDFRLRAMARLVVEDLW